MVSTRNWAPRFYGYLAVSSTTESLTPPIWAKDGTEAVRIATRFVPGRRLMDVRMPGAEGVEALRRVNRRRHPESSAA